MTADDLYNKANELRRSGNFAEALNLYTEAVSLDADSPAKVAKEMLEAQFAFFCKDYYNP